MTFISQCYQDRFLETEIFKGYKNGFFCDVGAHDGVSINNTLFFENTHDWTGINVEPMENIYEKLIRNRPKCINIKCAVSNNNGVAQFIQNDGYTEMLSGLKNEYDPRHLNRLTNELEHYGGSTREIQVETKKLETIFDEYNVNHINYLSVDVEGAEFEVIKSINFDKVFIDVIGFENNYTDVSSEIIKYLKSKNYVVRNWYNQSDIFMIHKDSKFLLRDRILLE